MDQLRLAPAQHARGEIHLPGSKSLTNRALLLAALAEGTTTLTNVLASDDAQRMLDALAALGVPLQVEQDGTRVQIQGVGGPLRQPGTTDAALGDPDHAPLHLFLGNAGTAYRPLTAVLAAGRGRFELAGEPRMYERPIKDLVDALLPMGADIRYLRNDGFPPVAIAAGPGLGALQGGEVLVRGDVSSQYLTSHLMAAPLAAEGLTIRVDGTLVSKPYISITLATMASFGVQVQASDDYSEFQIEPATYRSPGSFLVEGDASSATYFLAAAAIAGGPVRVRGIARNSVQGDVRFAQVLAQMGADITYGDDWIEARQGGSNRLRAIDVDLNDIPDAAMTIAAAALFADGTTTIRNIWNWRDKEPDRIAAMATELRKLGALVVEGEASIAITPPDVLTPATIDTYDDHRMAMPMSLACLGRKEITINDPGCVAKTFPDFFERLQQVLS